MRSDVATNQNLPYDLTGAWYWRYWAAIPNNVGPPIGSEKNVFGTKWPQHAEIVTDSKKGYGIRRSRARTSSVNQVGKKNGILAECLHCQISRRLWQPGVSLTRQRSAMGGGNHTNQDSLGRSATCISVSPRGLTRGCSRLGRLLLFHADLAWGGDEEEDIQE